MTDPKKPETDSFPQTPPEVDRILTVARGREGTVLSVGDNISTDISFPTEIEATLDQAVFSEATIENERDFTLSVLAFFEKLEPDAIVMWDMEALGQTWNGPRAPGAHYPPDFARLQRWISRPAFPELMKLISLRFPQIKHGLLTKKKIKEMEIIFRQTSDFRSFFDPQFIYSLSSKNGTDFAEVFGEEVYERARAKANYRDGVEPLFALGEQQNAPVHWLGKKQPIDPRMEALPSALAIDPPQMSYAEWDAALSLQDAKQSPQDYARYVGADIYIDTQRVRSPSEAEWSLTFLSEDRADAVIHEVARRKGLIQTGLTPPLAKNQIVELRRWFSEEPLWLLISKLPTPPSFEELRWLEEKKVTFSMASNILQVGQPNGFGLPEIRYLTDRGFSFDLLKANDDSFQAAMGVWSALKPRKSSQSELFFGKDNVPQKIEEWLGETSSDPDFVAAIQRTADAFFPKEGLVSRDAMSNLVSAIDKADKQKQEHFSGFSNGHQAAQAGFEAAKNAGLGPIDWNDLWIEGERMKTGDIQNGFGIRRDDNSFVFAGRWEKGNLVEGVRIDGNGKVFAGKAPDDRGFNETGTWFYHDRVETGIQKSLGVFLGAVRSKGATYLGQPEDPHGRYANFMAINSKELEEVLDKNLK